MRSEIGWDVFGNGIRDAGPDTEYGEEACTIDLPTVNRSAIAFALEVGPLPSAGRFNDGMDGRCGIDIPEESAALDDASRADAIYPNASDASKAITSRTPVSHREFITALYVSCEQNLTWCRFERCR